MKILAPESKTIKTQKAKNVAVVQKRKRNSSDSKVSTSENSRSIRPARACRKQATNHDNDEEVIPTRIYCFVEFS
jgi:hypothetical protein